LWLTTTPTLASVELYKSAPVAVGLQDVEKGEDLLVGPPAASLPAFYKTGTKQVTLEVTGTGNDPGPYTTAAAVTVVPEPVSGTWTFTLPAPATVVDWKAAYTVAGRFTNPTHATVTPTSIALDETSIAVQPTQRNASPLLGALAPGAVGTEAWSLVQTWSWLIPGVWIPSGPQGAVFTYTVTFAAQDEYGNAYPAATSPALAVTVRVSTKKLALAASALAATEIAVTLLALAFLALAGYYTAIAAPALFAAAGAAYGAASGAGAGALDPPVPDFDYHRVVPTRPPAMPDELVGDPALDPLAAVFALLSRTAELDARMSATEARLIGARIDRDDAAIHLQSAEYRDLRDSLLTTLEYIPVAVLAAVESEEANRLLRPPRSPEAREVLSMWSSEGLPAKLRRAARAGGLDAEVLKNLEQAFRSPEFVLRPIEAPLREISAAAPNLAMGVRDEAEAVLRGVA